MKYLVIVESPSKCQKIENYLNNNDDLNIYEVVATMGHITYLNSLENIDIQNDFTCKYEIIESRKKHIETIKKKIKIVDEVILACDDDREGEGICFFICHVFNLNVNKTKRIIFNEITEVAILNAIKNPKKIDINLVYAQQTRQILDLLIGFEISPILWKYICSNSKHSLSAGRCQTPALKLINDNQKKINLHPEKQVYKTTGYFNINNLNIAFELNKNIDSSEKMKEFLQGSIDFQYTLSCSSPIKKWYSPPEPLTTSKLQQICSNELYISPKETMTICQKLYEKGYITYMRTDSKIYSSIFIESAQKYIFNKYEEKYFNKDFINKNNSEENSNAHEAIRPTDVSLEELINNLEFNPKERKVYKLIWQNTLESLMTKSCYYSIDSKIFAFQNLYFMNNREVNHFPGWKIVKNKFINLESSKEYNYLLCYQPKQFVKYKKIISNLNLENTTSHYTESRLVQSLEEKGIGRPSTFASLIEKIQEREYVKKEDIIGKQIICKNYELENENITEISMKNIFGNEKNKLIIQPLGVIVLDFLEKHFEELFNYNYTKQIEDDLDLIAQGKKTKIEVCNKYYENIVFLKEKLREIELSKECIKIDDNHTFIIGKNGPVIKCINTNKEGKQEVTFKPIKKGIDIYKIHEYSIDEIVDLKKVEIKQKRDGIELGEYNNQPLLLKKGKYGLYVTWGDNSKSLKQLGNRPIDNVKFEEVLRILEK